MRARVLSLLTERVGGELLDAAQTLRVVSNLAVGVDTIDVAASTPHVVNPEVL